MFARVATFEGVDIVSAKRSSDAAHQLLGPTFDSIPGWMGVMNLADASTGRVISVAIFDSAEHAKEAEPVFEEEMPNVLGALMKDWSGKRVSVEQCEIILQLPR
jgi:hypothetical protein